MNVNTGEIGSMDRLTNDQRKLLESFGYSKEESLKRAMQVILPVNEAALSQKVRAELASTGRAYISRNSMCPCGSGKRFKRCCMAKEVVL